MKHIYFLLFFMCSIYTNAQVVTTKPAIPTPDASVTIVFDASKGNAGLNNYTGEIYAHIGVTLNGEKWQKAPTWGDNDAKYKLTKVQGESNKYELKIEPSIKAYFGVNASDKITQLCMVFRSGDKSKEGKGEGGSDIFVNVFEAGLNLKINTPETNKFYNLNDEITTSASATDAEKIELFINDNLVKTVTENEISHTFTATEAINYKIKYKATKGETTKEEITQVLVKSATTVQDVPANMIDGINYIDENTVTLVLFAPQKQYVYLLGDFNNWALDNNYQLKKSTDGNRYWITLTGLESGKEYGFQYLVDGKIKIADPYADKYLDPWNDKYIPAETYPNIKEYPLEKTDDIVSVFQTNQSQYNWTVTDFTVPKNEKLIIYELHLRDFTKGPENKEGNLKKALEKLDYIQKLGVNAIELMPFNEFEGNNSWGYNPSFYFAPDKAYGTKNDYKKFIDECHKRGIAVFMDMVLNHAFGQSPLVKLYIDKYADNEIKMKTNPWFNAQSPNRSYYWGADFNHESAETQKLVDRINKYWIEEYKIDGFRFDFTKGFTNKSGDGWAKDDSRIAILKRMYDEIKNVKSDAVVILEHLADNSEEKILAEHGMLLWGNFNKNYSSAAKGENDDNKSNFSGISYKVKGWTKPNLVGYMESHDEERVMYECLKNGKSDWSYNIKNLPTALKRVELNAAFLFTVPGPKMIWQFGELGYDVSINDPGRVDPKPVKWDYYDVPERKELYSKFSQIIKLRNTYEAFTTSDITMNVEGALKSIVLKHSQMNVVIVGNFDVNDGNISVSFPSNGNWYNYFTGEEVSISGTKTFNLKPEEYKILTSQKVEFPQLAPVVNNLNISGTTKEGETLTVNYAYYDVNDDKEGATEFKWYRADDAQGTNSTLISEATSKTYTLTKQDVGKYIIVEVTPVALTGDLKGKIYKITTSVDILSGIYKIDNKKTIKIYPNPTSDYLFFENYQEINQVEIVGLSGKVIIKQKMHSNSLNLSNLPKGIYLIRISGEGFKIIDKIIKK